MLRQLVLANLPKSERRIRMNVLEAEKQLIVIHHLLDGCSIRATERLTGVHRDTICRLIVSFGRKCREFLDPRVISLAVGALADARLRA